MSTTTRRIFFGIFFVLVLAACGGDDSSSEEAAPEVAEVESTESTTTAPPKPVQTETVSEKEAETATNPESIPTAPSADFSITEEDEDLMDAMSDELDEARRLRFNELDERIDILLDMPINECWQVDHLLFLNIEHSRFTRNGAEFSFDCSTGYWGWTFPSNGATPWEIDFSGYTVEFIDGAFSEHLPLDMFPVPENFAHPMGDGTTLADLETGEIYCSRGRESGEDWEIELVSATMRVYENSDDVLVGYPSFEWYSTSQTDEERSLSQPSYHSLEDFGLLPHSGTGLWSSIWFEQGPCPAKG